jgi:hypothetical protein
MRARPSSFSYHFSGYTHTHTHRRTHTHKQRERERERERERHTDTHTHTHTHTHTQRSIRSDGLFSIFKHNIATIHIFKQKNRNWTALHFASASGWPLVVERLVAAGAEVDACHTRKSSIQ